MSKPSYLLCFSYALCCSLAHRSDTVAAEVPVGLRRRLACSRSTSRRLPGYGVAMSAGAQRTVVVATVPNEGGYALMQAIRAAAVTDRDRVRIVTVAGRARTTQLYTSPGVAAAGVLAAHSPSDTLGRARRHAARLTWLLWELGIAAEREVLTGDPIVMMNMALFDATADIVIVALPAARPWQRAADRYAKLARRNALDLRVAIDQPRPAVQRWLAPRIPRPGL